MHVDKRKVAPNWVGKKRLLPKELDSISSLCDRCAKAYCEKAAYTVKTDKLAVVRCSGYRRKDCDNCGNGTLMSKKPIKGGVYVGMQYIRCRLRKVNMDKRACCEKHVATV